MPTHETGRPEIAPNPELLRSLGRLVRGLSALFWILPLALITSVLTARTETFRNYNVMPPVILTAWLLYALCQLSHFQRQERIWMNALDRARRFALINAGLSPFLFWWNQRPDSEYFLVMVVLMSLSGVLFLSSLNLVLYRLSAMLPDENLRQETKHFTTLNRFLLLGILLLGGVIFLLLRYPAQLTAPVNLVRAMGPAVLWLLVFLVLLPLAMTMALVWKIKEVILASVFGPGN